MLGHWKLYFRRAFRGRQAAFLASLVLEANSLESERPEAPGSSGQFCYADWAARKQFAGSARGALFILSESSRRARTGRGFERSLRQNSTHDRISKASSDAALRPQRIASAD